VQEQLSSARRLFIMIRHEALNVPSEMDVRRIVELTRAIDAVLLTWEPKPSLNDVIAAQMQSLAGAISATDPRPTLRQVKKNLEDVVADILRRNTAGRSKSN
jgi:hypothetical protein